MSDEGKALIPYNMLRVGPPLTLLMLLMLLLSGFHFGQFSRGSVFDEEGDPLQSNPPGGPLPPHVHQRRQPGLTLLLLLSPHPHQSTGETIRFYSRDPSHAQLPLVDIIMASTAVPIVFRPHPIPGVPFSLFLDGGTGPLTLPSPRSPLRSRHCPLLPPPPGGQLHLSLRHDL